MGKLRDVLGLYSLTALALGSYLGLDFAKEYKLRQVQDQFPAYVARIEQQYGPLDTKPRMVLQSMETKHPARLVNLETIAVNTSLTAFIAGRNIDSTVNHELAHIKFIQIAESIGVKTYVHDGNEIRYVKNISIQAISEGFADYVAGITPNPFVGYPDYYSLVKPVLDKLGPVEGAKKMLLNLPTGQELGNFQAYHARLGV